MQSFYSIASNNILDVFYYILPSHQIIVLCSREMYSWYFQFHLSAMHEATYKSQMRSGLPPDQTLLDAAGQTFPFFQLLQLYILTNCRTDSKILLSSKNNWIFAKWLQRITKIWSQRRSKHQLHTLTQSPAAPSSSSELSSLHIALSLWWVSASAVGSKSSCLYLKENMRK